MANKSYTLMELEAIKKLCKSVNLIANLPTDLIADTNVATNTTYSSYRIDAEMSALENDIQRYVDTALAGLSRLTKEVIDDKALVVKENVLYLYKDPSDMNNDYMQMMLINGVAVELGSTTCDFSSVYSKDEIDDKFALKIDLDVLTTSFNNLVTSVDKKIDKDKIVTVLDGTVTDDEVASAKAVVYELGLKANDSEVVKKTDIATTINSTSTDGEVASAKAVYENHIHSGSIPPCENIDDTTLDNGLYYITPATTGVLPRTNMYGMLRVECHNNQGNIWYYQTLIDVSAEMTHAGNSVVWVRTNKTNTNTWNEWKRLCTTKVADVPLTSISLIDSTNYEIYSGSNYSYYEVINGICYVEMIIKCISPVNGNSSAPGHLSLPTPRNSFHTSLSGSSISNDQITLFVGTDAQFFKFGTANGVYIAHFSYPVAE